MELFGHIKHVTVVTWAQGLCLKCAPEGIHSGNVCPTAPEGIHSGKAHVPMLQIICRLIAYKWVITRQSQHQYRH